MPHAEATVAAPPVTPRILRNRLRLIPSVIPSPERLVVTDRAVARDFALDVALDAPAHLQRGDLVHLRHTGHVAVTGRAAVGAENLDVPHMREMHEAGQRMDPRPLRRLFAAGGFPQLAD